MFRTFSILTSLGLGWISGAASAADAQAATWRLGPMTCEARNCSARLVSSTGEKIDVAGHGLLMTRIAADRRLAELNTGVAAADQSNG